MDSGRLLTRWHLKVHLSARFEVLYKRLSALYLLTGQQTPAAFGVSKFRYRFSRPSGLTGSGSLFIP